MAAWNKYNINHQDHKFPSEVSIESNMRWVDNNESVIVSKVGAMIQLYSSAIQWLYPTFLPINQSYMHTYAGSSAGHPTSFLLWGKMHPPISPPCDHSMPDDFIVVAVYEIIWINIAIIIIHGDLKKVCNREEDSRILFSLLFFWGTWKIGLALVRIPVELWNSCIFVTIGE